MRSCRLLCLVLLAFAAFGAAPAEWSLRVAAWQTEDFTLPGAAAQGTERRSVRAAWYTEHGDARTGFVYAYQPILIRTGDPATNGYLHRLDFEHAGRLGSLSYDFAVGLHGSSNMFSYGELRSDVLVGRFRIDYPLTGVFDSVGLAGDYRFGEFLVYPRFTKVIPMNGTQWVVDFPVKLAWRGAGGGWRIAVERYGEHWATLDTSESIEGKLYFSEWRLEGRVRLWQSGDYRLDAGVGLSFDTEARYLDLQRGRVEGELEPALFVFLRWAMDE